MCLTKVIHQTENSSFGGEMETKLSQVKGGKISPAALFSEIAGMVVYMQPRPLPCTRHTHTLPQGKAM